MWSGTGAASPVREKPGSGDRISVSRSGIELRRLRIRRFHPFLAQTGWRPIDVRWAIPFSRRLMVAPSTGLWRNLLVSRMRWE